MLYTEQEAIEAAKAYIIALEYDKARQLLVQYPNNATAKLWLAKLDQMAFKNNPAPNPFPSRAANSIIPPSFSTRGSTSDQPNINPWDPSLAYVWIATFLPLAMIFLSLNWRRLGKAQWALETFLLGILAAVAFIASIVLETTLLQDNSTIAQALMVGTGVLNYGYWVGVTRIQSEPYENWKKTRDPLTVLNHSYKFGRTVLVVIILAIVAVGAVEAATYLTASSETPVTTATYENDRYSVDYTEQTWIILPTDRILVCQSEPEYCNFALNNFPFGSSTILFASYPINTAFGLESLDTAWWQHSLSEYPYEVQVDVYERTTIDGLSGFVREFSAPEDGIDYYYRIVNLIRGSEMIQIQAWSSSQSNFENDRADIMEVIDTIDFK
jgi:hypothetical protein